MNPEASYPEYHFEAKEISVLNSILESVREIAYFLQHSPIVKLETENKFGDQQLHQDVHCDELVERYLRKNPQVKGFASEERPHYEAIGEGEGYVVTYDPLDGSSIVDTNFSVGSIFSIWHTDGDELVGKKLREQVNAVLAIYGPRTTVILYNPSVNKVQELSLLEGKWILSHEHCVVAEKTKIFSPGNLRAASENQAYNEAVQKWISKGYTLRYTGGLVVDVSQIFIKGHGIFSAVASPKHKAKLRVLYEVAAVGFLIEKAEGKTITLGGISLLDYEVKTYDDRMYILSLS